jgi:FkbM family methyltransferase
MIDERRIIEDHFTGCDGLGVGRFLELGANNGVRNSLTVGLVESGWSGVQVEPDPLTFLELRANRGDNESIALVNAAVTPFGGMRQFWSQLDGGEESTLDPVHRARSDKPYHRPHWVNSLSVVGLLAAFGGPLGWDFLLIDVEGISGDVLAVFPLAAMANTSMVCVEVDDDPRIIEAILAPWYTTTHIGCNVIGVRR